MSYTPTTWTTGDTITASALNKIENGIADAGGGGGIDVVLTVSVNGSYTVTLVEGTYNTVASALSNGDIVTGWCSFNGVSSPLIFYPEDNNAINMTIVSNFYTIVWHSNGTFEVLED